MSLRYLVARIDPDSQCDNKLILKLATSHWNCLNSEDVLKTMNLRVKQARCVTLSCVECWASCIDVRHELRWTAQKTTHCRPEEGHNRLSALLRPSGLLTQRLRPDPQPHTNTKTWHLTVKLGDSVRVATKPRHKRGVCPVPKRTSGSDPRICLRDLPFSLVASCGIGTQVWWPDGETAVITFQETHGARPQNAVQERQFDFMASTPFVTCFTWKTPTSKTTTKCPVQHANPSRVLVLEGLQEPEQRGGLAYP